MPMNMEQMEKHIISAVDRALSMELQVPSVCVYRNGVAKKVIGIGKYFPDSEYDIHYEDQY